VSEWTEVSTLDDVWEGEMTSVTVEGKSVLLVNVDGQVRAYENRCPHQAWALDEGDFDGEQITCMRHMWVFDAATGRGVNPTNCALKPYPSSVDDDGTIRVDVRGAP
jgi:toluene monooxygenase system ferredoxin subunit